jgi:hypothetical protein
LIFVSHRRAETRDITGRLADRLVDRFGEDHVFLDVVAIEPGSTSSAPSRRPLRPAA